MKAFKIVTRFRDGVSVSLHFEVGEPGAHMWGMWMVTSWVYSSLFLCSFHLIDEDESFSVLSDQIMALLKKKVRLRSSCLYSDTKSIKEEEYCQWDVVLNKIYGWFHWFWNLLMFAFSRASSLPLRRAQMYLRELSAPYVTDLLTITVLETL